MGDGWQRYLRILAVPLIVIILILVIVLADRRSAPETSTDQVETAEEGTVLENTDESSEETDGESSQADPEETSDEGENGEEPSSDAEGESEGDEDQSELRRSDIPEITALMEEYCAAKVSCDAEAMYRIYGRTDMTGVEELRQRMEYRARYVENIENVESYLLPGLEDNSYVVYVTADIKFRVSETLAPTIMWCYVRMEDDGTYHIVENVTAEEAEYAAKAERTESVSALAAQVDEELELAIASDSGLASAYSTLREGTTVPDSAAGTAAAPSTDGETAAEETSAQ